MIPFHTLHQLHGTVCHHRSKTCHHRSKTCHLKDAVPVLALALHLLNDFKTSKGF